MQTKNKPNRDGSEGEQEEEDRELYAGSGGDAYGRSGDRVAPSSSRNRAALLVLP